MTRLVIASQLDDDFNQVIPERLALSHPEARVFGVTAG
ncbi:dihydrofolate reductase, partial [Pseudomonas syringae]|nr:dihydrofolate reductase [Pseudomonas syringae]